MASLDVIRTLTIKAQSEGMHEMAADLQHVAAAAEDVARATTDQEKATLSVERAYGKLQSQLDQAFRAQQQLATVAKTLQQAEMQGHVTQERSSQLMELATQQYIKAMQATGNYAKSTNLARYELINLGRQAQDVVVGLQAGQSAFTVLIQQGSQIADVFFASGLSMRDFGKSAISGLASLITPLTVTVAAIATLGGGAITAALQWGQAQQQIRQALTGIGVASGQTVDSINAIGKSSASAFGLSISEATEFATALAATGRIGTEVLSGLVLIAKDLSRAFGQELAQTTEMVAKAFTGDLAKAALELNNRLGSFDAAIVENIKNLQAQGLTMQAQVVLFETMKKGIADQQIVLTTTAKFWTALGNAVSDAWTRFGEFLSKTSGVGFTESLQEQIKSTTKNIEELKKAQTGWANLPAKDAAALVSSLEKEEAKLIELTKQWDAYNKSIQDAQGRRDSFVSSQAVAAVVPEMEQKQGLVNQLQLLLQLKADIEAGRKSLETMTFGFDDLEKAIARATAGLTAFKSNFGLALQASELAIRAAKAFGPVAQSQIAFEQERNQQLQQNRSEVEANILAENKRREVLARSATELDQAAKMRKLANEQAVESAMLEIDLIGKTAGQQAVLRANLQAEHQLRTAAKAAGVEVDQKELDGLKAKNAELEKITNARVKLDQINQATAQFIDTLVSGFADGKSAVDALANSLQGLGKSLISTASQDISKQLIGSVGKAGEAGTGITGLVGGISGLGSMAGPAGAAAGLAAGIGISLLSKAFGKNSEEATKTAAAIAQATKAFHDLQVQIKGDIIGSIMRQAQQFQAQALDIAQQAAEKAGKNTPEVLQAYHQTLKDIDDFVDREIKNFRTDFAGTISSLNAGEGFRGAGKEIRDFSKQFLEFMQDMNVAFANDVAAHDQARAAGKAMALSFIAGAETMSDTEREMKRIDSSAQAVTQALQDMGLSAEDAAQAVNESITMALQKLRDTLSDSFIRDINEMVGGSWINQAQDAFKKLTEGMMAGVDPAVLTTWITVTVQKIIDGSQLTGDAFNRLSSMFPQVIGQVHEFNAAIDSTADVIARSVEQIAQAIQSNQDRLFTALHQTGSLNDQLALFDLKAQREREAEAAAGGQAIVSLEAALAQERLNIVNDFNAKAAADAAAANQRALEEQQRAQQQALEEQQRAAAEALEVQRRAQERIRGFQDQLFTLQQDQGTLQGRLAVADRQAQRAREEEYRNGGQAIVALEALLQQQRLNVVSDFYKEQAQLQQQALDEQKRIDDERLQQIKETAKTIIDYINGILTGPQSSLSPANRLRVTQGTFEQQLRLAQSGDLEAQKNITKSAEDFRQAAKDFFGSSNQFQAIQDRIIDSLGNLPAVHQASDPMLMAAQDTTAAVNQTTEAVNETTDAINKSTDALNIISGHTSRMYAPPGSVEYLLAAGGGFVRAAAAGMFGPNVVPFNRTGTDSVPAMLTPGEFIVRQPVASANAASLVELNKTGNWPDGDMSGAIRNLGTMLSSLLLQIAELQAMGNREIAANTQATHSQTQQLNREQRFARRKGVT